MKLQRYLMIVLLSSMIYFSFQLVPNRQTHILNSPIDMKLSQNQYYTAIFNKSHVGLYNAQVGNIINLIYSNKQYQYKSIDFSWNSKLLAYSTSNGKVEILAKNQEVEVQKWNNLNKKVGRQVKQQKKYINDQVSVTDICFTANDTFLIIAYNDGIISVSDMKQKNINYYFDGLPMKIGCSASLTKQFTIAGKNLNSQSIILSTLIIDSQKQQIHVKQIIDTTDVNLKIINDIMYNNIDNSIYISGDSNLIYKFQHPNYASSVFYQGEGQLYKINILGNQTTFVVCNQTNVIIGKTVNTQKIIDNKFNQYKYQLDIFQSNSKTFAISSSTARFLYVNKQGTGQYLGQCQQGKYFDIISNSCSLCQKSCTLCTSANSICFQCNTKHFLTSTSCQKCQARCQTCQNANSCSSCQIGFIQIQGQCGCAEHYQIIDNACSRKGVKFWVVAIVVGGSTLLLCMSVVIYSYITNKNNKEKSQNQLLKDQQTIE